MEISLPDSDVEQVLSANSFITTHVNVKSPLAVNSKTAYTIGISAKIQGSDDLLRDYVNEHGIVSPNLSSYYTDSPEILNTSFSIILLGFWDALWIFLQRIEVILGIIITMTGVIGAILKFLKRKRTKESPSSSTK